MKFTTLASVAAALLATSSTVLSASVSMAKTLADAGADREGGFVGGDMLVTSKFDELEARGRHHRKHKKMHGGKLTWYNGDQLLRPACPGMPTPDDWSMTAAISLVAPPAKCGDRIQISRGEQSVVVTMVDYCAACTPNWIDVTKGVFRHFDSVSAGVLEDMEFTVLGQ